MNLTRDELQVLLWACEHEILRLPSERNEQQTLALLSATTKVREAYRTACEADPEYRAPLTASDVKAALDDVPDEHRSSFTRAILSRPGKRR